MNAYAFIAPKQEHWSNMKTKIYVQDNILILEDTGAQSGFKKAYSLDSIYNNYDELFASIKIDGSHRIFLLYSSYSLPPFQELKNTIISFFCNFYQFFISPVSIGMASYYDKNVYDYLNQKYNNNSYELFSTSNLDQALDLIDVSLSNIKNIDKSVFVARIGSNNFIELVILPKAETLVRESDILDLSPNLKMLLFLKKSPKLNQKTLETACKVSPYIRLIADSLINTRTSWVCNIIESSPLISNTELFRIFHIANGTTFSNLRLNESIFHGGEKTDEFNSQMLEQRPENNLYRGDLAQLDPETRRKMFPNLKFEFNTPKPNKQPKQTNNIIQKPETPIKSREIQMPLEEDEDVQIIESNSPRSPIYPVERNLNISIGDNEYSGFDLDFGNNSQSNLGSPSSFKSDDISFTSSFSRRKKKVSQELIWPESLFEINAPVNVDTVEKLIKEMSTILPDVAEESTYEYEEDSGIESFGKIEQLSESDFKEAEVTLNFDSEDEYDSTEVSPFSNKSSKQIKSRDLPSLDTKSEISDKPKQSPSPNKVIPINLAELEDMKNQVIKMQENPKVTIEHQTVKFVNEPSVIARRARNLALDPNSNAADLTLESLDLQNEIQKVENSLEESKSEIISLNQKDQCLKMQNATLTDNLTQLRDTFIPLRQAIITKRLSNANFDFKNSPRCVEMLQCISSLQDQIKKLQ